VGGGFFKKLTLVISEIEFSTPRYPLNHSPIVPSRQNPTSLDYHPSTMSGLKKSLSSLKERLSGSRSNSSEHINPDAPTPSESNEQLNPDAPVGPVPEKKYHHHHHLHRPHLHHSKPEIPSDPIGPFLKYCGTYSFASRLESEFTCSKSNLESRINIYSPSNLDVLEIHDLGPSRKKWRFSILLFRQPFADRI
jgi:hypothetical protein